MAVDFVEAAPAAPPAINFQPERPAAIDFQPSTDDAIDTNPVPDLSDPAAAGAFFGEAVKPLITVAPRTAAALMPGLALLPRDVAVGIAEGAANVATGATTSLSIGLGALAVGAPAVGVPLLSILAAKDAGERTYEAGAAFKEGDARKGAQLSTEGFAALVTAVAPVVGAALKGVRAGIATAPEAPPVIGEAGVSSLEAPPAPPVTAEANAGRILGVAPPLLPEAVAAIKTTATRLDQLREGFARELSSDVQGIKADITRKLDAADNEARIEGQQVGNGLRLDLTNQLDREAVTFIVEANGDPARLAEFMGKVGGDAHAATVVEHAQANWQRLSPAAERVNQLHEQQLAYEQSNGIDPGDVEGYVRHSYDMDAMIGRGRPVLVSNPRGGAGVSTSFKKQRTFATYADAIEAGFKPRTFDVADLVESRVTLGERLVNRTKWAQSFSDVLDPLEGRPVVRLLITQPKGTQVAPLGYVPQELMPGIRVAVHEGYANLFASLLGTSAIQRFAPLRVAMQAEAGVKHGMLLLDTFHAGRMLYKELALARSAGHDLGRSLLEYADADLDKAVAAGEITQEAAGWARANRPDAELLTVNGLNVGRVSDALYKDVVRDIPVIGTFNRWVFDKLTRGAMMHSGIVELNRLRKALPGKSDAELAGMVASNLNSYYGNLGRQGVFKDPTLLDMARLVFLAPQWVEGMARTEAGAVKQLAMPVKDGKLVLGPLAKGVGTGVLAMVIANQLINYATRGHPTWQNEEHGHQLDAWIPDVTGNSAGFFLSPLSVFAELSHDAVRYYEDNASVLETLSRITSNKLSPLAHAEEVLRTGKDWQGRTLQGDWARIWEAGKALVPVPIPASGLLRQNAPPGSLQRQLFASAGVKIEPAPSADSQLYRLATHFKEAQGIKEPPSEPSEYRDLNNALRKQDWKQARTFYDELAKSKPEQTIREHYIRLPRQLYTGKRSLEAAFRTSLNDSEERLFELAREERQELQGRFFEMLQR